MKAMILAAGLGKRMRPLTERTPKPLLQIAGRYLIDFHLENLADAGIKDVVINTHWLAEQIPEALGSGEQWGLSLTYSYEPVLLETAGGILQALPSLSDGDEPFLLVNGDIYTELKLRNWLAQVPALDPTRRACLAMVSNPSHHIDGDFGIDVDTGLLVPMGQNVDWPIMTYSGIGIYHPAFFDGQLPGPGQLGPLLKEQIQAGHVLGSVISEYWLDVGTPERYRELCERLPYYSEAT